MMFLTMPDIKIVTCSIGNMNCQNDWVRVLTPLGLDLKMLRRKYLKFWFVVRLKGYCLELKLVGNQNFNLDTKSANPNIFALIVAANFSQGLILEVQEIHEFWPWKAILLTDGQGLELDSRCTFMIETMVYGRITKLSWCRLWSRKIFLYFEDQHCSVDLIHHAQPTYHIYRVVFHMSSCSS